MTMKKEDQTLYAEVQATFQTLIQEIEHRSAHLEETKDQKELTDLCYVCREVGRLLDGQKTEVNKLQQKTARLVVLRWIILQDPPEKYVTKYCTGTPDVSNYIKVPTRKGDFEEYCKVMKFLKIPEHLWEDNEIVRIHYPGWLEYLNDRAKNGKPIPKGCDVATEKPVHDLKLRRKKGVLEPT